MSISPSVFTLLTVDWFPPEECKITDNPLAGVTLDTDLVQASFTCPTVWDSHHNIMQEIDLGMPEYETDIMVKEIDNMTEVGVNQVH